MKRAPKMGHFRHPLREPIRQGAATPDLPPPPVPEPTPPPAASENGNGNGNGRDPGTALATRPVLPQLDLDTLCGLARANQLDAAALDALVSRMLKAQMNVWDISTLTGLTQHEIRGITQNLQRGEALERVQMRDQARGVYQMLRAEAVAGWMRSMRPLEESETITSDYIDENGVKGVRTITRIRLKKQNGDARLLKAAVETTRAIVDLDGLALPRVDPSDPDPEAGMKVLVEYVEDPIVGDE